MDTDGLINGQPVSYRVPSLLHIAHGDVWEGEFVQANIDSWSVDPADNHIRARFEFRLALHGITVNSWCRVEQIGGSVARGTSQIRLVEVNPEITLYVQTAELRGALHAYLLGLVGPDGMIAKTDPNSRLLFENMVMEMPFPFLCNAIPR